MIAPGTMVPYIPGVDTVLAEVLGTVRSGEQYMLRLEYVGLSEDGERVTIREDFQRDVKLIKGFNDDSFNAYLARSLRN